MKWSNKHIWRCPIKAEKCYTHGRHDGKHHKVELLTAATVTLLGAHRCFWCKYCHFWAAWYSGSPYSEEWTVMMVYSRNNLQLSLLLNYTSKRKKKHYLQLRQNWTWVSSARYYSILTTYILHISAIVLSLLAPSLKSRIAGQHQYNPAARVCGESMCLSVRTLRG